MCYYRASSLCFYVHLHREQAFIGHPIGLGLRFFNSSKFSPPASPRRNTPPPPSPSPPPLPLSPRPNMNNNGIVSNTIDSLTFVGFSIGSNSKERDAVTACKMLARKHHPDKNDPSLTGLDDVQETVFFQTLNNAFSCIRANENLL